VVQHGHRAGRAALGHPQALGKADVSAVGGSFYQGVKNQIGSWHVSSLSLYSQKIGPGKFIFPRF
jgi:hypothetical protein